MLVTVPIVTAVAETQRDSTLRRLAFASPVNERNELLNNKAVSFGHWIQYTKCQTSATNESTVRFKREYKVGYYQVFWVQKRLGLRIVCIDYLRNKKSKIAGRTRVYAIVVLQLQTYPILD